MKYIITSFLLSALSIFTQSTECFAQVPDGSSADVIVEYLSEIEGQKVGKGVCFDLARATAEKVNKKWYKEVWCDSKAKKRSIVAIPEPGDLINFSGVVMKDGNRFSSHIGIVYKVLNDSLIVIAHQNVCESKERTKKIRYYGEKRYVCSESVVTREVINLRQKIKGKIVFMRVI
jgi:ribosomal protein S12